jgi:hypothetical protein
MRFSERKTVKSSNVLFSRVIPHGRIDVEVRKHMKFWSCRRQRVSDARAGVELRSGWNSEESEGFSWPQKIYFPLVS